MSALLAGLPTSVPGPTINRLCGSSLDAAMQASRTVETGDASLTLVGASVDVCARRGSCLKPVARLRHGDHQLHSTTLGWRWSIPEIRVSGRSRWARARRSSPASTLTP